MNMKKIYMAILVSALCFVFMDIDSLWAQKGFIYEVALNEQVNNSFQILEGKVIDQKCFWNKERNLILTAHTVEVYKTFKGEAGPIIEVLTLGGSIDGNSLRVSSELNLRTGDMGVFMLKKAKEENWNTTNESFSEQFEVVSAEQGFYRYNLAENKVSNPFSVRTDIENDFYEEIKSLTDGHVKEYKNFELEGLRSAEKLKNAASIAIESFSPQVTTAGTQSVVQIKGTGFGTDKGTVGFRYANDGGASFYDALASEIVSWNDTAI